MLVLMHMHRVNKQSVIGLVHIHEDNKVAVICLGMHNQNSNTTNQYSDKSRKYIAAL